MSATPLDLLREVLESESAQPQVTPPQLQPQQRAPPQPPQPKSTFAPPAKSRSKRVTKQSKAPSPAQEAQEPTLAGSSNATHRCSQCKQEKTLGHFPTRLTTLQPFLVCKSHLWYWTPEKKELHWAPESESSIDVVCDEVQLVLDGDKTSGSWIVSGTAEDRSAFVNRIAAVQGWVAQSITMRKSRANGPAPPTPFHYQIKSPDKHSTDRQWRLVVTLHEQLGKFVISFKEDVGRKAGSWAKRERREEQERMDAAAAKQKEQERKQREFFSALKASQDSLPPLPELPPLPTSRSCVDPHGVPPPHHPPNELQPGQTDVFAEPSSSRSTAVTHHNRASSAPEFPPPKRVRRVEPSQLPPSRPLLPNPPPVAGPSTLGFAPPPPPLFAPPVLLHPPTPPRGADGRPVIAPRAAFAQLPPSFSHHTSTRRRSASPIFDPSRVPASHSQGRRSFPQNRTFEGLTLDQLLASPFLDPPTIPLQQRTMQLNAAAYNAARTGGGARGRSVSEGVTSAAEARASDAEAVDEPAARGGDAQGGDDGAERDGAGETDLEDGEEESSEEEDDDDGGDWLTGFVKGQLHGIGQGSQEEVDELESGGEGSEGE